MGCALKYVGTAGTYAFDTETTMVPMARHFEHNERGNRRRYRDQVRIRSVFAATDEADVKTKTADIYAKLIDAGKLTLYQTNGSTKTEHEFDECRFLSITFPEPTGPELFNRRTFEVVIESWSNVSADNLLSFREVITILPGGRRRGLIATLEGPPQGPYTLVESDIQRARQTGSSVGRDTFPTPPNPRFLSAACVHQDVYSESTFRTADGELRYVINWEYSFADKNTLVGHPASWNE